MTPKSFLTPFLAVARFIGKILSFFLGSLRLGWSPPPWLRGLARHPRALALSLLLMAGAAYGGLRWWQWREAHRVRPRQLATVRILEVKLNPPGVPSLNLQTGKLSTPEFSLMFSKDAAPLDLVSKVGAPKGVKLSPEWPGAWVWGNAKNLSFMPAKALPAGTKFTVTLGDEALAPLTELATRKYEFTTPALTAKWGAREFYTDPKNPEHHQAVFRVVFNQPVSREELSKRVTISAIGGPALFADASAPEVLADAKDGNTLHVRSAKIRIPEQEDFVRLAIGKGLVAMNGGEPLGLELAEKVTVPTKWTGFRFTEARTQIVPNEDGEPQQFVFVETLRAAETAVVAKAVEAWLLPEKEASKEGQADEEDGDKKKWTSAEVTPEVLAKATKEELKLVEGDEDTQTASLFAFRMPPSAPGPLFLRVTKGMKAPGGFELAADYSEILQVPMFPREARVLGKGGVLALSGERKLNIKSRGYSHLRYTLARVPAAQINHLASQTEGRFEAPEFDGDMGFENLARFHSSVQTIAKKNDHEANYSTFDFAPALGQADAADPEPSRGLFQLQVEGVRRRTAEDGEADKSDPDPQWMALNHNGKGLEWDGAQRNKAADRRFILITDLGLVVKRNADGTREVFVQSFRERAPVAGVRISALAKNGEVLAEATTADDGHATLPALDGLKRERKPAALVARKDADLAFIPWAREDRAVELSRFDIGGVKSSEATALDASLFTERGIYRPGDSIHLAAIVRTRNWLGSVEGLPVEAVIYNSKEAEAGRFPAKLPADGFIDLTIPTSETAPTGVWRLELRKPKDPKAKKRQEDDDGEDRSHIAHIVVRVEDFQPDRMKMALELDPKPVAGWLKPAELKAKVELQTLFGIAAAERKITAKMRVSPTAADFAEWPKWNFHLPKTQDFEGRQVDLPEQESDEEGKASITLDVKAYTAPLFRVGLEVEAFEPDGGRGVKGGLSTLISPRDYLLGWRAEGDMGYLPRDVAQKVRIVAIGPDLKPVAAEGLRRVLVESRQVSVLTKQGNGSMAYVSREKEKEVESVEASLPAGETVLDLAVAKAGRFRYEWRDKAGVVLCAFSYNVVGPGEQDRNLERDTELELTLPAKEWRAGEQLEVSLRAPYAGAGLITIERDRVLAWQWFKADTASSVQRITVPEGLEGGAYVHVAFVRGLDSPEIFTSPLSVGVAPFKVAPDRRVMTVELDAPERVRPGEALKIGFRTPRAARVVVWAVDEGIHRVSGYRPPDPLAQLLRGRALEVESWQLLDLLLPEFSLLKQSRAFGGDGDEPPELKLGLNPFKRRRAAPVVFWSGIVEAGPDRKEVLYQVPDYFAGRLNLMAAVVAPDAVGISQRQTVVKGPFVLTQNMPFFAVPGDEFTASLTVANQLEGAAITDTITVKAEPDASLEILEAPAETVKIAVNTEETVRFRVRVKDTLGNAELKFSASAGTESVGLKSSLSVRPATPYLTEVQSGWFRQPTHEVKVGRDLFPQFAKREAVISPTPFGFARGLEAYLRQYPHGCAEQITSKAFPWLVLKGEADFGIEPAEAAKVISDTCRILSTRQMADGGFGYWTARDGVEGFDFLTVYVGHFLTEARSSGFTVPEPLMAGTLRRLKAMAGAKVTTRDEGDLQAAAIYLLTRGGEVTTNYALNLTDTLGQIAKDDWHRDLSAAWLAGTWSLLKKETEAQDLIAKHVKARAKNPWVGQTGYYYDSSLTDAAQSLTVLCRHFPKTAGSLGFDDLKPLTEGITSGNFNTLSAAWSIMALKSYAALVKQSGVKLGMEESVGGQFRALGEPRAALFGSKFAPEARGLRFLLNVPQGGPDLGAWYQTIEIGYARTPQTTAKTSGLEIHREFLDDSGKVVSAGKVGETLKLRLRIRNVTAEEQAYIALVDLLPGGFDNAPGSLSPGLNVQGAEFVDVREDRNLFFTDLNAGESKTFTWDVRPTCAGIYTVPPAFGEAMYDRAVNGSGAATKFTVQPRE